MESRTPDSELEHAVPDSGDAASDTSKSAGDPSAEIAESHAEGAAKPAAEPPPPLKPDGRAAEAQIEVLPDDLRANVIVLPPVGEMPHITEAVIEAALTKRNVTYGVKKDVIKKIVFERSYMHTFTVAEGLPPVNGQDASLIYHYSKKQRGPDRSLENLGAIDWRENSNIINVNKDDLLLEKIPPTPGEPGRTVTNRTIPQKKGQDIRVRAGKGVRSDTDGILFHADRDGEVTFRNNQLTVNDVHTVEDVDATTGNVRFNGNIHVAGLVNDGFVVEAKGTIRIDGSVGAARVVAGGDVFVAGGLLGSGHCTIISQNGNVTARFAQGADIVAAKSIAIQEYARDCRMMAGESVRVISDKEEHGIVVGGRALAVNEFIANNIGSPMEKKTEVVVGLDDETVREITRHEKALDDLLKRAESVCNALRFLQKQRHQQGTLDRKKTEMQMNLKTAFREIRAGVLETLSSYQNFLLRTVGEAHGRIEVRNHLYSGTTLNIGGDVIEIEKTDMGVVFVTGKDGVVRLSSRTDA